MKNKKILLAMMGIILSLIFVSGGFAQTAPTPLEGVWSHPNADSLNARITFAGNSFTYSWALGEKKGTFTSDNRSNITFNADDGTTWTSKYTLKNDDLTLTQGKGCWYWYGTFVKYYQNLNIEGTWKHPMTQAKGATFKFSGNNFIYTRNDNVNYSGTIQRTENTISLIISDVIVRMYTYRFTNNGSTLELISVFGDGGTFYFGPFNKQ